MARQSDMQSFSEKALSIFKERHSKYGTTTPRDVGTALAMCQVKLDRAKGETMDDATFEDTMIDLANYASIALLIRQGLWDEKD